MQHHLDEIDIRLIKLLQDNGRITNSELAEHVGLSPSGCLRRVQHLEQAGVISGYHAALSAEHVALGLQAFLRVVMVRNARENLERFTKEVGSWPEVVACYSITGDSDYLMHVVTQDLKTYKEFMMSRLLSHPLVDSVNTSVVLGVHKERQQLPLDHLTPPTK